MKKWRCPAECSTEQTQISQLKGRISAPKFRCYCLKSYEGQTKQLSELVDSDAIHVFMLVFFVCILSPVACPLLLFWPLVCEVRGSSRAGAGAGGAGGAGGAAGGAGGGQDEGGDAVMEMRLRESPQEFSSALLQLSTRYLTVLGAQVRRLNMLTMHTLTSLSWELGYDGSTCEQFAFE